MDREEKFALLMGLIVASGFAGMVSCILYGSITITKFETQRDIEVSRVYSEAAIRIAERVMK